MNNKRLSRLIASIGLVGITLIWLLPIIWLILTSLRDPSDTFYSGLLPKYLTLNSYKEVFSDPQYTISMRNSGFVAFMAASISILIATLAAYGFTRFQFRGKKGFQTLLLVVRLFPGVLLAITFFLVAGKLGIYDTHYPLIIANVLFTLPLATWNLRTMFANLPVELEEAAWLDGATRLGGMINILFPLMLPSVVTTWAYAFLLSWNEYLFAMSFIRSPGKQMIVTAIAGNIGQYGINYNLLVAAAMMATVPLLVVFLFIQRYIISGQSLGALKG
jgi:ABC-type glycerol-3-phosphate transport system permease component